jgi:hypothetical protein
MEKLNEFIIKQLNDSKVQRCVIKATDLFTLCNNMGILEDDELMIDIIEYLENAEIDINFAGGESFYRDFTRLENKIKMGRLLRGIKTEVQLMIEKTDSIKVPERPKWLNSYMDDEQKPDESEIREDINNQYQRITDMLTQKLRDQIENEPGITLEEIQRDVQLEMGMTDEMLEQLRNAPTITEQQINQIRNNGSDVTGEGF